MKKIMVISFILFFLIISSVSAENLTNSSNGDVDNILMIKYNGNNNNIDNSNEVPVLNKLTSDDENIANNLNENNNDIDNSNELPVSSELTSNGNIEDNLNENNHLDNMEILTYIDDNSLGSANFYIKKTALTPVVNVGDDVYFEIYVVNNGWGSYTGQWITINDYFSDGLEYIDYAPNPDSNGNTWASNYGAVDLIEDQYGKRLVINYNAWYNFQPNYSFSFTTHFKSTKAGKLNNSAQLSWQNNWWEPLNEVWAQDSIYSGTPGLNITKTVQKEIVGIDEDIYFDIYIENNGTLPVLDDYIYINDWFDDGLKYIDYSINPDKNGIIWSENYEYVGIIDEGVDPYGKRLVVVYKTYGNWEPGSTINFTVHFKAKDYGKFNNKAQIFWKWKNWGCESNHEWIEEWGNSSVVVGKPEFEIEKISDNNFVKIGDEVKFKIIVKNIGIINITGFYIKDNEYSEGLEYLTYFNKNLWRFDGKDTWFYNNVIEPNESIILELVFKAITSGVKFNTAFAGHNLTNETQNSTANVTIFENNDHPIDDGGNNSDDGGNNSDDGGNNSDDGNEIEENESSKNHKHEYLDKTYNMKINSKTTGNPLFILLLMFFLLIFAPINKSD